MKYPLAAFAPFFAGVLLNTACSNYSESSRTDVNNDQKLSKEEVENRLVEAIFEKEDKNGDGKVTSSEWLIDNPDCPLEHFKVRDTNKDDVVKLAEFQEYADSSGLFDDFLSSVDLDGNDDITPSEAQNLCANATR